MNKSISAVAAAAMLIVFTSSAFATDYGRPVKPFGSPSHSSGKGVGKFAVGLAIGAGLVGAAIAANRAQAGQHHYQHNYHGGGYRPAGYGGDGGMCRVWRADCRSGIESGCLKYERRC